MPRRGNSRESCPDCMRKAASGKGDGKAFHIFKSNRHDDAQSHKRPTDRQQKSPLIPIHPQPSIRVFSVIP